MPHPDPDGDDQPCQRECGKYSVKMPMPEALYRPGSNEERHDAIQAAATDATKLLK